MSYDQIPIEMRSYPQWINWKYDYVVDKDGNQKQTKVPVRCIDDRLASINNPLDWSGFTTAVNAAIARNLGVGFVFTKSDPYAGIDLDDPEGDIQTLQQQQSILERLNSYSERSPSGKGLHIIVKAALSGPGKHPKHFGCFDAMRYFTFTGDVYHNVPIAERYAETLEVYNELGSNVVETAHTGYEAEVYTDAEICEKAYAAHNGEKFLRLWNGDWQTDYGRQSQSEADFALINIIGFYSRNLPQTIRIFRQSALGQRPKAKRGDYVSKMAKRAFDRLTPQISIVTEAGEIWFDATKIDPWAPKLSPLISMAPYVPQEWVDAPVTVYPTTQPLVVSYGEYDPGRPLDFEPPKPPPAIPGLVGMLIEQAWEAAPFQVAEVAIASALSTMSMLCSRSYRHGTLGLSLYLLVLAQTSTGKSFGYKANDAWHAKLGTFYNDVRPPHNLQAKARADLLEQMIIGEIGSAQGLAQHMPRAPSTLFHADEYVDAIKEMSRQNPAPHVAQIKSELLRLMEMSGPGRVYRGRKYSMRSTSAAESVNVFMASLTILATGTPEAFYNDMSESILTSGFLPRFTILEYEGGLTRRNMNIRRGLNPEMMQSLMKLFDKAYDIGLILTGDDTPVMDVQPKDEAAATRLEWWDNLCYREIQAANLNERPMAGMFSRAKEHVRQIASLIAIGCNPYVPTIERSHVDIAIGIVRPTLDKINAKVTKGETGLGDDRLEAEVKKYLVRLTTRDWRGGLPSGIKHNLLDQGFIQLAAIKNFCGKLQPFKAHRLGANAAFENAIMSMAKYGVIKLMDVNGAKCCQVSPEHFQNG